MLGRANTTLKPDRNLLNPRFEQYKYASDRHCEISYKNTDSRPHRITLPDSEYSYHLTRNNCLFNFLHTNPAQTRYFTVTSDVPGTYNLYDILEGKTVISVKSAEELWYNVTLQWSTEDIAYLIVGAVLYKLKISSTETVLLTSHTFPQQRMSLPCNHTTDYLVTCYKEDDVFVHQIIKEDESCGFKDVGSVNLSGIARFVSVTNGILTLVSEGKILTGDVSAQEISETTGLVGTEDNNCNDKRRENNYTWIQTMDDVEVTIDLPKGILKADLVVDIGTESLEVHTKGGQELFKHDLFSRTEPQESSWQMSSDKSKVEITLCKYQSAHNWASLTDNPNYDRAGNLIGEISDIDSADLELMRNRLKSLDQYTSDTIDKSPFYTPSSDMEECDEADGEQVLVSGYDIGTLQHRYMAEMTPGCLLFTQPGKGFVVANNVDAVFYSVHHNSISPWKHIVTYHGFNHIQASKTHKKYILTGPEQDYVAIIDTKRNIYLYKAMENQNVGKLIVLTLDDESEILGAHSLQNRLVLLTENNFITINFKL